MKRLLPLCLVATTGCASIMAGPQPSVRADFDPRLNFPVTRVVEAKQAPRAGMHFETSDVDSEAKIDKATPALFWTGIIVGLVGGAVLIATGIDGRATVNKIEDGYDDGFTRQERDDLEKRGARDNTLSKVAGGTAVVGFSLATIMAGIDYSRCGPLTKKRKCTRHSAD